MGEQDFKIGGRQKQIGDEFDRVLDAALAKHAAVEPRPGLEERVLANLRAQPAHGAEHVWWRWGLAALATAAVVVAVAVSWRSARPFHPPIAHQPPAPTQSRPAPAPLAVNHDENPGASRDHGTAQRTIPHPARPKTSVAANPRLDQFPSPRPLSEQEKLLARYVATDPEHAALIAEARTEELRQREAEELRDLEAEGARNSQR